MGSAPLFARVGRHRLWPEGVVGGGDGMVEAVGLDALDGLLPGALRARVFRGLSECCDEVWAWLLRASRTCSRSGAAVACCSASVRRSRSKASAPRVTGRAAQQSGALRLELVDAGAGVGGGALRLAPRANRARPGPGPGVCVGRQSGIWLPRGRLAGGSAPRMGRSSVGVGGPGAVLGRSSRQRRSAGASSAIIADAVSHRPTVRC
jgi:hypothetical protein